MQNSKYSPICKTMKMIKLTFLPQKMQNIIQDVSATNKYYLQTHCFDELLNSMYLKFYLGYKNNTR